MILPSTKDDIFLQAKSYGYALLHAGAARIANRVFLFPGASGNGKSTLLATLAASGVACSDEYVLMKFVDGKINIIISQLLLLFPELQAKLIMRR